MTCSGYLQKCLVRCLNMLPRQSSPQGHSILNDAGTLKYFHVTSWMLAQLSSVLKILVFWDITPCRLMKIHRRHCDPPQRRAATYRSTWRNITKDLKLQQLRWENFFYPSFLGRWFMTTVHHSVSAYVLPNRSIIMTLGTWKITVAVLCIQLSEMRKRAGL
jgi:hypothetical protein